MTDTFPCGHDIETSSYTRYQPTMITPGTKQHGYTRQACRKCAGVAGKKAQPKAHKKKACGHADTPKNTYRHPGGWTVCSACKRQWKHDNKKPTPVQWPKLAPPERVSGIEPPASTDWLEKAKCREMLQAGDVDETNDWYAPDKKIENITKSEQNRINRARDEKAITVCFSCPVRKLCLAEGFDEVHGVWGGLTAAQRASVRNGTGDMGRIIKMNQLLASGEKEAHLEKMIELRGPLYQCGHDRVSTNTSWCVDRGYLRSRCLECESKRASKRAAEQANARRTSRRDLQVAG